MLTAQRIAAPVSPGLARRFPFSAALWTRREVSFGCGGGQHGEFANDDQSQRALGIDSRDRAVCVFRRIIASSDDRRRHGDKFEIGKFETGQRRGGIQTRRAPLEEGRAP
jgi:hypothetical protein